MQLCGKLFAELGKVLGEPGAHYCEAIRLTPGVPQLIQSYDYGFGPTR